MAETKIEIVVSGDNAAEVLDKVVKAVPEATVVNDNADAAAVASEKLQKAVAASAELPTKFGEWAEALAQADAMGPFLGLVFAVLIVCAAYAIETAISIVLRPYFMKAQGDDSGMNKIKAGFLWAVFQALRLVLFYALVKALIAAFAASSRPVPELTLVVFQAALRFRILYTLFEFLAASRDATRRPTGLTDAEAKLIIRLAIPVLVINSIFIGGQIFIQSVLNAGDSGTVYRMATLALVVVIASAFFFAIRRPIARILRLAFGSEGGSGSTASFFMDHWYALYSVLLILTALTEIGGALNASVAGSDSAASYSFQVFILTPFVLAGLTIWRKATLANAAESRHGLIVGTFALIEGFVIIAAAILILLAWKIDPFATDASGAARILPRLVSAALIIVVGISIWRTASAFLKAYAPKTEEPEEGSEVPDGEGGRSGSRFETIFPIIRITTGVLIATLTAMVALAALGVQIGPLLAGAGIFGLAFGFGAQTLVKDIISGMFYLYEDAFRVGEFIESDEGKGAVEKILLRSVRLRHPRGAIFTIPFGSLGPIKNHSRDWVTMKFSFEVAQTEDLERVRKLVKKVGAKLQQDPDVGDQFIEPLKSQGALDMRGANYVIGVKFTCKPGDQFLIRRKAFAAIQKAIVDNDIKIAMPKVVVDTGGAAGVDAAAAAAAASQVQAPAAGG